MSVMVSRSVKAQGVLCPMGSAALHWRKLDIGTVTYIWYCIFGAAKSGYRHRWDARCQSPFFLHGSRE